MPRGRPRKPVSPCRFCNTSFKRAEHLRRHERTHTQEKPFDCKCGQAFSRKDLLVRHTKLSHSDAERRCTENIQSPVVEERPLEQITAAKTMPSIVSWSARSNQPANTMERASSRDRLTDAATDTSVIPQALPEFLSLSSAPLDPISDGQIGSEQRSFSTDQIIVTDHVQDRSNGHDTLRYLEDPMFEAPNEFGFLWDWDLGAQDFLPTAFLDSEQLLANSGRMGQYQNSPSTMPSSFAGGSSEILDMIAPPLYKRLPPLEPDFELANNERLPIHDLQSGTTAGAQSHRIPTSPWNISIQSYRNTCDAFLPFAHLVNADFSFPTRRTLSRFLEAYFQEFHQHLPFLHMPTTMVDSLASELVLAMAAVGAYYRFEDKKGYVLYLASKAIIMHRINAQHRPYVAPSSSSASTSHSNRNFILGGVESETNGSRSEATDSSCESGANLQTIQALTIITALASWSDKRMSREALVLASQLGILVREGGISMDDEIPEGTAWLEWIHREQRRRTLLAAYVLFNMQSIAFNVPPTILNQDVYLCLPHCGSEWEATSASQFARLRHQYGHDERSFRGALEEILHGRDVHAIGPLSAFGNYVLMVGLVQQIFLERHVLRSLSSKATSLTIDTLKSYEAAFRSWHHSWEATHESSLDPSSPKGPLGFDAAALLWLGYIRLNADVASPCDLMSKDPQTIARAFASKDALRLTRTPHLDRAVLQCVHALSRPVRAGIPFVARSLASKRSVQHALCSLESAYLLSRWLDTIADVVAQDSMQALRHDENSVLGMVASLIKETDLAGTLERSDNDARTIRYMAATVVRLWAGTFSGSHVFHIMDAIGEALTLAADMLEQALNT